MGRPLWDAFRAMGRPPSMNGPTEITNQEILAYQQIENVRFTSWELGIIRMFDAIAIEAAQRQQSNPA